MLKELYRTWIWCIMYNQFKVILNATQLNWWSEYIGHGLPDILQEQHPLCVYALGKISWAMKIVHITKRCFAVFPILLLICFCSKININNLGILKELDIQSDIDPSMKDDISLHSDFSQLNIQIFLHQNLLYFKFCILKL